MSKGKKKMDKPTARFNGFQKSVSTVGELVDALKQFPRDMKLDLAAFCYEDADHYSHKSMKRDCRDYDEKVGISLELSVYDNSYSGKCPEVLRISNDDSSDLYLDE